MPKTTIDTETVPANCMACEASLERGYVTEYGKNMEVKRHICSRCHIRDLYAAYAKDKLLNTRLLTEAYLVVEFSTGRWPSQRNAATLTLEEATPLRQTGDYLAAMAAEIEQRIWFDKDLQTWVQRSKFKGARFDMGDGDEVLIFSMCGRCRMTLQTKRGDHFTVQCDESRARDSEHGPSMGYIGVAATKETVENLVSKLLSTFDLKHVKVDKKVSVF